MDDVNYDGINDIAVGTVWGSRAVFAISGRDGSIIWHYDTDEYGSGGWVYEVDTEHDFNNDGIKEVLAAGNFFPFKISLGQMDASFGSLLQFKNGKWFSLKETAQLSLRGDIRDLNTLHFASGVEKLLVTLNNDSASLHRFPESN